MWENSTSKMGITRRNFLILTLSFFLLAITSCGGSREPSATYTIGGEEDDCSINLPLLEWHVCGVFSPMVTWQRRNDLF